MESGQQVIFDVHDNHGGVFGAPMAGGGSGALSYSIAFSSLVAQPNSQTTQLDLTHVTDLQFYSPTPKAYGFAIHSVTFY